MAVGATAYGYDANGNTVAKIQDRVTTQQYGYDLDNRLVAVTDGADNPVAAYGYDPFGRRLWKEVGGARTYFLYSDEGLVGEYDEAGIEAKSYGWLPGATWGTDPLFMAEGGQFYWYLNDHLGTPRQLIASDGRVVWSAEYGAFGKAEVDAGSEVVNNLRFPGQYWDEETGLHYNWFRYYDPETGRYWTVDPIGFWGGDVDLYRYVGGNAINAIDPSGLMIPPIILVPPGAPPIVWNPTPPPTIPLKGLPWIPINTPPNSPTPGEKFELCMKACKALLASVGCPRMFSGPPCTVLCLMTAFGGDKSNHTGK